MMVLRHLVVAAFLLCSPALFGAAAEQEKPAAAVHENVPLPNAESLRRLARRALLDAAGVRMHVGPVTVKEKLADGSYLVEVTLESGRRVKGRLFRNRRRYRITVDRRDLFAPEKTVVIKKD